MIRLATLLLALSATAFAQSRPNIIFVLTDDLGWGDLGVLYQNSRNFSINRNLPAFVTPKLDAMAAEGVQLRRHYCPAPVCAPSRASLLLGVHQGHANVRDNQFDKELANNHTLGTVLKQAGYATTAIGKWGLQGGSGFPGHPQNRGFDYFFGYMAHLDAHHHYPKEQGRAFYENFTDVAPNLDKCYSTDLSVGRAKKWIVDHRATSPSQPFFMYLCFAAPHARLNVPTGAYPAGGGLSGGIQWTGTPGAMINTATGTIDTWIHPDYDSATWDHDNNPGTAEQAWPASAKRHATMVRRIDDAIGDLLQTLDDLDIGDNTLLVFSSDNGPHNEAGSGGSFTQDPRFFRSYGPLDGIKRDAWEGGIRVPTLARWPAGIPAARVSNHPSQFHDWMKTFAELAGVPAPMTSDGVSLVPALVGSGTQGEGLVYVEYMNSSSTPTYTDFDVSHRGVTRNQMQAVFLNGYKGVRYNTTSAATTFRVHDVAVDPQETTNLAGQPGVPTQAEFEAKVARGRRAGGGVTRPYDAVQIPPVTVSPVKPGMKYAAYESEFPWVPDFVGSVPTASGETIPMNLGIRTRDNDIGLSFQGYLQVPADGDYTFFLSTDTGAFVRLHDAQLLDADFGYPAGTEKSSGVIPLKAGLHPIRIHYRHATAASHALVLQWQGPGITKQAIPAGSFFTEGANQPGPPTANDDAISTAYETSVLINVLGNDSDDGTPAQLSIQSVGAPNFGTASIESGQIRYTPPAGFSGTATFIYTISDGSATDTADVTVTVTSQPQTGRLWITTFNGSDGSNRNLVNTNSDPTFTDTLAADDANLTFEDSSFTGTLFMHSNNMATGTYYSPNTNVDNPGAASPQNGGWWQTEFRYSGGSQRISLDAIDLEMLWSNSSGVIQSGTGVRDITLSVEYSLDGGAGWTPVAAPQTYDLTEPSGNDQIQIRTFAPAAPIIVRHATQDLWLRVRAENAGITTGAYVDIKSIAFQGTVLPEPTTLWATTFSGADGTNRNLINTNGDPSFTDTLAADDANLTFEDSSFTGTVFMHSNNMGTGTYYSPRTNVDNPAAASPQNGGWWQAEFRYTGGSQTVSLTDIRLNVVWSNSSGTIQTGDATVRDITLTAEYSLNGGASWFNISSPQTYNLTVNGQNAAGQHQDRTFTPATPIAVNHATQDLWLRVRAENANATAGAYVNISAITFVGTVVPVDDYNLWAQSYPGADLTDPEADLDRDGVTNNDERIWGLDPTSGISPNPFTSPFDPATGFFTYTRRLKSLTGIDYTYQWSDSLNGWTEFTPANETASGESPIESVTVEVPAEIMGSKFFIQVVATQD